MLRNLLAATTVLLILLSLPANAAPDALPGGACSPDGLVQRNGGAETAGVGHTLVCQGGTWKAAITFNGAGQLTELGNQTCAATEILKFDGTKWACAADDAGTGADNLGNHIATTTLRSDTHNTDDLGTTAIRWKDGWFQGTVTGGTFAGSGASLTALNATNLGSGTLPDARFPATLPAISGVNLTNLNATNLASGTVGTARLGSGTADSTTFLRGDNTWATLPSGGVGFAGRVANSYTTVGASTWTKPAGADLVYVECWGGGGSGGRGTAGCGGGGGGYVSAWFAASELTATVTVTIGDGPPGRSSNGNGTAGGASSFGAYLVAPGGGAGTGNTSGVNSNCSAPAGGSPAIPALGMDVWRDKGGRGGRAWLSSGNPNCSDAGDGGYYAGGGGQDNNGCSVGTSIYGGAGGAENAAGSVPGGGGGGASSGTSGAGGDGRCNVITITRP